MSMEMRTQSKKREIVWKIKQLQLDRLYHQEHRGRESVFLSLQATQKEKPRDFLLSQGFGGEGEI